MSSVEVIRVSTNPLTATRLDMTGAGACIAQRAMGAMPAPERSYMRSALFILTIVGTLWSTAAFAQERRGYVEGAGNFIDASGAKTGGTTGEVGFKVAPNLVIFGTVGNIHDVQSAALQTPVDQAVSNLALNNDLTATGIVRNPAWYSLGGARIQFPNRHALTPYVLGGIGFARLNPSTRFTYESGTPLSGDSDTTGTDITTDVVTNGFYTQPVSTTGLMLRTGAGVQIPVGKHLLGDIGYNVSRISADTPVHTQNVTFGLGFRF